MNKHPYEWLNAYGYGNVIHLRMGSDKVYPRLNNTLERRERIWNHIGKMQIIRTLSKRRWRKK